MSYYKRVIYMDYLVQGEKVSNAGFVKILKLKKNGGGFAGKREEYQRERICMQIYVQNLPQSIACEADVKLVKGEWEIRLGTMEICDGRGVYQIKDMAEYREDWENCGLKMEGIPGGIVGCELRGPEGELPTEERVQLPERMPMEKQPVTEQVITEDKPVTEQMITAEQPVAEQAVSKEQAAVKQMVTEEKTLTEKKVKEEQPPTEKMHRDKWKQLWEQFPHVQPFVDEREYLRLGLKDMLVLPGRYYRLVENSFLLHGYYNYKHLILAKTWRRGAEKYYLGVPGNYYEREKQVAAWFGFESFEPGAEPASEGDFGYYMISVEL